MSDSSTRLDLVDVNSLSLDRSTCHVFFMLYTLQPQNSTSQIKWNQIYMAEQIDHDSHTLLYIFFSCQTC